MTAASVATAPTTAAAAPGCATVARTLGESPEGTATPMRSWLLIEHAEAWSHDVADRVLRTAQPRGRQRELGELRRRHGLRPLLARRPGTTGPSWSAARTPAGAGWSGWSCPICASWPTSTSRPWRPAPAASASR